MEGIALLAALKTKVIADEWALVIVELEEPFRNIDLRWGIFIKWSLLLSL